MWYVCDVLYAVFYVCVICFVVHGCDGSRRYITVCSFDIFSVLNMYLDHLKFCVVCIIGRRYVVIVNVMLSLVSEMNPPPDWCNLSVRTVVKLCILVFLL